MELFAKAKAVKLRSHLDKYLVADDDKETVRQSRNGSSPKATWFVEIVQTKTDAIRLRSCHDKYLTASDTPLLLGMTGHKVLQTVPYKMLSDWNTEWEPVRDGFQVKIKSWCGKYLRANGWTPPWRNSVTHDEPHGGPTKNWVLWDVVPVEPVERDSLVQYLSSLSSFSSVSGDVLEAAANDDDDDDDDQVLGSEPVSPVSVMSLKSAAPRLTMISSMSPKLAPKQTYSNQMRSGMEFFRKAKAVRLRSHHDKYLHAEEDDESVTQDRNGSSKTARWAVEFVPGSESIIRLKSCYGKYLTASNQPFLLGMTGRKVIQSLPRRLDSSLEWEPIREGSQVKLKTRYGNFLRANGGLPPWRNSVTHDIPQRTSTQDWILWDVDVVEILVQSPGHHPPADAPVTHSDSLDFESSSPSSVSIEPGNFSRQSSDSYSGGSPPKSEGRTIYYQLADESGVVDDVVEGYSFNFKGNGVDELTAKLMEVTGLDDIIVCTRSPLNGKLYPLRLQLPPNNSDMHVTIIQSSAEAARDF